MITHEGANGIIIVAVQVAVLAVHGREEARVALALAATEEDAAAALDGVGGDHVHRACVAALIDLDPIIPVEGVRVGLIVDYFVAVVITEVVAIATVLGVAQFDFDGRVSLVVGLEAIGRDARIVEDERCAFEAGGAGDESQTVLVSAGGFEAVDRFLGCFGAFGGEFGRFASFAAFLVALSEEADDGSDPGAEATVGHLAGEDDGLIGMNVGFDQIAIDPFDVFRPFACCCFQVVEVVGLATDAQGHECQTHLTPTFFLLLILLWVILGIAFWIFLRI